MFLILALIRPRCALIISGLIMLVRGAISQWVLRKIIMRVFLIVGAAMRVVGTLTGFLVGVMVC